MQENNNVYFLYNNVALLYNNAPKQDQDRKKRTFLRKNQGYHPVLEFYSKQFKCNKIPFHKSIFVMVFDLYSDVR